MTPSNLFNPKLNVSLNTQVLSDAIVLVSSGTIQSISNNLTIYKNNQPAGTITTFVPGDSIQIQVTSSSNYSTQTHAITQITIDSISNYHIFTCVTFADIIKVSEFANIEPFEFTKYANGEDYFPTSSNNKVLEYDDITKNPLAIITKFNYDNETTLTSNPNGLDSIILCSFYDNKVYRMDASTNNITGIINVEGNPFGAVAIPRSPVDNPISDLWVVLSNKNKVVVLDNSDNVIRQFSVGNRPLGIATTSDYYDVWVANSYDNTVTHIKWDVISSDWITSTISVGLKPFEIACDTNGNAWVTCAADNKVYRITQYDEVTSYVVGKNPRGIAYNNGKMWIAVSQEEKVIALDLGGNLVNTLSNIGIIPFSIGSVPLPVSYRLTQIETINVTDIVSINRFIDTIIFADSLANNRISDNFAFIDTIANNILSDSFLITDSIDVQLSVQPPSQDTLVDPLFNYVNLLIS